MNQDLLDKFRREINWHLAQGALADVDLPVTSDDGGHPVVAALEDELLSTVLGRVRGVGGFANLFVHDGAGVRMVSVINDACAIAQPGADMSGPEERPGPDATVGMFLDYVARHPNGVSVSAALGGQACARDARAVDFEDLAPA
ncbi:hypothetical protein [Rhodococcus sp. MEB064]|uniref:hypothetical protein n=1 Tax=Rhodococcus sp. MEB064 TaxID=1587522 RepID=UPI0012E0A774|nr:hypothetical protein [Rhodococcus sp. MEB064]